MSAFQMKRRLGILRERIKNQSNLNPKFMIYRLSFMKMFSKYFNSEWSVSKIKVEEKLKTVGFDVKNHRLIIITYDRILYYVDIPETPARYLDEAEVRAF